MKIWIFNHYAITPDSSGGTRHFDLAKEFVKKGDEVTIFASSFEHQLREDRKLADTDLTIKEELYNSVKFVWVKTTPYYNNDWRRVVNMLEYTFRVFFHCKKREDNPDIIIGSLMHPLAALIGYILSRKKGSKFYFEERDLWPQSLIDFGKATKWNPIVLCLSWLELFLYKQAEKIIVLFDKAPQYVVGRGIKKEKVLYVPNGIDISRFESDPPTLPENIENKLNELKEKFIVIYTGSHAYSDYLESALEAAEILDKNNSSVHFLFIGDGQDKTRLEEMKTMKRLDNVTFLPPVSKMFIPSILKRANAGLICLRDAKAYTWGFSLNKMYDYMAAKLPIVMLSQLKDTVIDTENCGITVHTPVELANSLNNASLNKNEFKQKGINGRAFVEKNHTWDVLSNKIRTAILSDCSNTQE